MGKESPQAREARFRSWWAKLTPDQRAHEVRSGHVRVDLPAPAEKAPLTAGQRKAARRRARGKR